MSNVATISFKVAPHHYAIVRALADSQHKTVSEFVRETVEKALDLDRKVEALGHYLRDQADA